MRSRRRKPCRSASACCWSISAPPTHRDAKGVRVYLKEFLSDSRVIEDQGLLWKLILNGIILRVPSRAARHATIRRSGIPRENESPLKTITRAQAEKLAERDRRSRPRRGRLGDALRQPVDPLAHRCAGGAGLRPAAGGAALSAIFRGDFGDRLRRGFPRRWPACARSRRCA